MGEVELQPGNNLCIMHAFIYFYGNAANDALSMQVAKDIETHQHLGSWHTKQFLFFNIIETPKNF